MKTSSKIIIALDYETEKEVLNLVDKLEPLHCKLKVGKELFTRCGPSLVKKLVNKKFDIFLDLKYHDIPNTVAQACVAAADLGVWMLNVHALGGEKMMSMAKQTLLNNYSKHTPPYLIAVTWLTSSGQAELDALGIPATATQMVAKLATMTKNSGLDGVVCSAQEASVIREKLDNDFLIVTPGIRLAQDKHNDQQRVVTPKQALLNGASYLVIGRPITQAKDPYQALQKINASL